MKERKKGEEWGEAGNEAARMAALKERLCQQMIRSKKRHIWGDQSNVQ